MLTADTGILILRLVVGLYVAAHGAQKLFGWFDGPGLQGTIGAMGGGLGFRPASLWVLALTLAEVVGGVLMVLGFLGPIGPLSVAGAMLGAALFAHWSNGPWSGKGGYELAATNLGAALAVALLGVGQFSVDAGLGIVVPQSVAVVFAALVLLGVLAAALSRRPQAAVTQ
jgi:putative oxidoreductase